MENPQEKIHRLLKEFDDQSEQCDGEAEVDRSEQPAGAVEGLFNEFFHGSRTSEKRRQGAGARILESRRAEFKRFSSAVQISLLYSSTCKLGLFPSSASRE